MTQAPRSQRHPFYSHVSGRACFDPVRTICLCVSGGYARTEVDVREFAELVRAVTERYGAAPALVQRYIQHDFEDNKEEEGGVHRKLLCAFPWHSKTYDF